MRILIVVEGFVFGVGITYMVWGYASFLAMIIEASFAFWGMLLVIAGLAVMFLFLGGETFQRPPALLNSSASTTGHRVVVLFRTGKPLIHSSFFEQNHSPRALPHGLSVRGGVAVNPEGFKMPIRISQGFTAG